MSDEQDARNNFKVGDIISFPLPPQYSGIHPKLKYEVTKVTKDTIEFKPIKETV